MAKYATSYERIDAPQVARDTVASLTLMQRQHAVARMECLAQELRGTTNRFELCPHRVELPKRSGRNPNGADHC
jgi:hypothetical protein